MTDKGTTREETGETIGTSLFSEGENDDVDEMISFADQFVDKVRAIHDHFDKKCDGFLNFEELSSLQLCTSGQILDSSLYGYLCQGLGCQPDKGLSLDGLKLTYASEGANVDEDYEKVFGKNKVNTTESNKTITNNCNKDEEETIYEVGDGGVFDLSPEN